MLDIEVHRLFFLDGGIPQVTTRTCFGPTCDTPEFLCTELIRLSLLADNGRVLPRTASDTRWQTSFRRNDFACVDNSADFGAAGAAIGSGLQAFADCFHSRATLMGGRGNLVTADRETGADNCTLVRHILARSPRQKLEALSRICELPCQLFAGPAARNSHRFARHVKCA